MSVQLSFIHLVFHQFSGRDVGRLRETQHQNFDVGHHGAIIIASNGVSDELFSL
jgi:hypothetical protein